jgi:hypothetical protein
MKKHSSKIFFFILLITAAAGCKKYLNINSDPANPQAPSNSSVFPAMLAGIPRGFQFDARYVGKYDQNWLATASSDVWDRHGYLLASDNSGDIWRQTYYGMGRNLVYIIQNGLAINQLDYVGAAYALQALMFQTATDYHGEIIFHDAFKDNTYYFKYDLQPDVYKGVDSLCRIAISYLDQAAAQPASNRTLSIGDYVYNGDVTKWKKFVYGILARNWHHQTNHANYNADSVISFCDKSFSSGADDFLVPFDATRNDDANFFGTYRDNLGSFRQSNFVVHLLDGTTFTGNTLGYNRDPRIAHMLSASQDTTNGNGGYRGVDPGAGDPFNGVTTGANARKRVAVPWGDSLYGNPSASSFTGASGKFLFKNKAVMPVMTYSELQFIKSEAAFRKSDPTTAYSAYLAGINADFDFINRTTFPRGDNTLYNGTPISAGQRAAYLASANVKQNAASLTRSDIMLQKYIALWGWGWVETFVDLRRYHYNVDLDPLTGQPVYRGFTFPATFFPDNNGKPAYRFRPRYNSEYVWNLDELKKFGGDKADYHTYEMWFSKP